MIRFTMLQSNWVPPLEYVTDRKNTRVSEVPRQEKREYRKLYSPV